MAYLLTKEWSLKELRRAIGRDNPEAMFRELEDISRFWWLYAGDFAESLKSYGYDSDLVLRERSAAKKLFVKKELASAKNLAWLEERLNEMRWKEAAS
jgi:hypothetical protein